MTKPAHYEKWTPFVRELHDAAANGSIEAARTLVALIDDASADAFERVCAWDCAVELSGPEGQAEAAARLKAHFGHQLERLDELLAMLPPARC